MPSYTMNELKSKKKKQLIEIAENLNLDASGTNNELVERIFTHKPSFKEMVDAAPVLKNGDLTISIEDVADAVAKTSIPEEDIPVGVEVNNTYEEDIQSETTSEDENKDEIKDEKPPEIAAPVANGRPSEDQLRPLKIVGDNTAEDILKGWQHTIQGFYRKHTPGMAPSRPASPTAVAEQLGVPGAVSILAQWQEAIISQLRPIRGLAPTTPKTPKEIIQIIKGI
ncbi:hypothetical protein AYK24_00505 [Thermoplasmatales archaeon SG8-52-4]|nr:MAG: hypothetical protein AYK24_00505 [Thermoplasmatales archaeon SG8-52-4]